MGETEPKVSIIVPCYNQGQYLYDAVESVFAQTYSNWEIIVIDDGSTQQQTIDLLHNYTGPKTTIIKTLNQGPSAARNHGIRAASGKYILPLDADDKIANFYLEKAVPILEQNDNIGIVYGQGEFFGAKSGRWKLPNYSFPEILLGNLIFNSSIYRKSDWERVKGYNTNMVDGWEDYDFWLSIIELGREVFRLPEVVILYRQLNSSRDNSLTKKDWINCHSQIFHNHPNLYANNISFMFEQIIELREQRSLLWKLREKWLKLKKKLQSNQHLM